MNVIHLGADSVNGVYEIDPADYPEENRLNFYDFLKALSYLDGDETLVSHVVEGSEEHGIISEQYGVGEKL